MGMKYVFALRSNPEIPEGIPEHLRRFIKKNYDDVKVIYIEADENGLDFFAPGIAGKLEEDEHYTVHGPEFLRDLYNAGLLDLGEHTEAFEKQYGIRKGVPEGAKDKSPGESPEKLKGLVEKYGDNLQKILVANDGSIFSKDIIETYEANKPDIIESMDKYGTVEEFLDDLKAKGGGNVKYGHRPEPEPVPERGVPEGYGDGEKAIEGEIIPEDIAETLYRDICQDEETVINVIPEGPMIEDTWKKRTVAANKVIGKYGTSLKSTLVGPDGKPHSKQLLEKHLTDDDVLELLDYFATSEEALDFLNGLGADIRYEKAGKKEERPPEELTETDRLLKIIRGEKYDGKEHEETAPETDYEGHKKREGKPAYEAVFPEKSGIEEFMRHLIDDRSGNLQFLAEYIGKEDELFRLGADFTEPLRKYRTVLGLIKALNELGEDIEIPRKYEVLQRLIDEQGADFLEETMHLYVGREDELRTGGLSEPLEECETVREVIRGLKEMGLDVWEEMPEYLQSLMCDFDEDELQKLPSYLDGFEGSLPFPIWKVLRYDYCGGEGYGTDKELNKLIRDLNRTGKLNRKISIPDIRGKRKYLEIYTKKEKEKMAASEEVKEPIEERGEGPETAEPERSMEGPIYEESGEHKKVGRDIKKPEIMRTEEPMERADAKKEKSAEKAEPYSLRDYYQSLPKKMIAIGLTATVVFGIYMVGRSRREKRRYIQKEKARKAEIASILSSVPCDKWMRIESAYKGRVHARVRVEGQKYPLDITGLDSVNREMLDDIQEGSINGDWISISCEGKSQYPLKIRGEGDRMSILVHGESITFHDSD